MAYRHCQLVAVIDFGTTYSGVAFSFHSDFQASPVQVYGQGTATGGVQVTPDQKFHSFSTEAEEKYARLFDEDRKEAARWYFFERFIMQLYTNPQFSRDTELLDKTRRKGMLMVGLLSAALHYIEDQFTTALEEQETQVKETDIMWVLMILATWEERARQTMWEAAGKAGIAGDQLTLVLEPEAASVFCLHHYRSLPGALSLSQPRKRFLLADCGVDEAFKDVLFDLMDTDCLASVEKMEFLQLMPGFESAKRMRAMSAKNFSNMLATIKIAEEEAVKKIGRDPGSRSYRSQGKVSVVCNIMLDRDLFLSFFHKSAQSIPNSIGEVMNHEKIKSLDATLLAGGFSKAFPYDTVEMMPSASASVLTGAVLYGHNPDVITTRVSAFTYGVDTRSCFVEGVHDGARLVFNEVGESWRKNCFDVHITIDQEVVNMLLPYQTYAPSTSDQIEANVNIYRSTKEKPLYMDEEGSLMIVTVTVLMPDKTGGLKKEVKAAMKVGGTELKFFAKDETIGKEFTTTCDFLAKN